MVKVWAVEKVPEEIPEMVKVGRVVVDVAKAGNSTVGDPRGTTWGMRGGFSGSAGILNSWEKEVPAGRVMPPGQMLPFVMVVSPEATTSRAW